MQGRECRPGITARMVRGDEPLMGSRLRLRSPGVVIVKDRIQDSASCFEQPRIETTNIKRVVCARKTDEQVTHI